jgi:uronate dehydrogenase
MSETVGDRGTVLVTGGAGRVALSLRTEWAGRFPLRLFDRAALEVTWPSEEAVRGDVRDLANLTEAAHGCRAIIHLAGLTSKEDFDALVEVNLRGTYNVFEAAVAVGCPRVVFASTNHVTGFYPTDVPVSPEMPPRPDSLYGASKVFGEALGRLYHDRYGLEVAVIRIGSSLPAPTQPRHARTWLSDRDLAQLIGRCLDIDKLGWLSIYGVSDNAGRYWRDDPARSQLGYQPQDRAAPAGDTGGDRFQGGPLIGQWAKPPPAR